MCQIFSDENSSRAARQSVLHATVSVRVEGSTAAHKAYSSSILYLKLS